MLRIKLLGAFSVWVQGAQILRWPRRDACQLLKLLAIQVGHRMPRHQAMEALWPNSQGTGIDLDHKLKNAVYALRRVLEPQRGQRMASHYIQTDAGTISLGPASHVEIDCDAFEQLLDVGLLSEDGIEPLEQAVAIYQGPLLPEDEFEPWVLLPRTHLEQRQAAALRTLAQRRQKLGQHEHAIAALQRLVRMAPSDEDAHRALIELFTQCGRPWDAKRQYAACKASLALELGLAPSTQTRDAFLAAIHVLGGDEPAAQDSAHIRAAINAVPPPRFTPPAPLVSLIARAQETQQIKHALLHANTRLLTLSGPAGVGKTQLAIRVAHEIQQEYTHGVAYVALADVANAYAVPGVIGRALAIEESTHTSWEEALARFVAGKHMLLVLDNIEHLLGATPLVCKLLTAGPGITVLATSRVALHLAGEKMFPLPLLLVPAGSHERLDELEKNSSITLLVQRAQAHDPAFRLTAQNAHAIAAICRRLDGLPLAIELAAARMRLFTPEELMHHLESSFSVLHQTQRGATDRHCSLEAVLQWSYKLLPPTARRLFNWMGMFSGGATLASLQGVLQSGTLEFDTDLELLIDHHLVIAQDFSLQSKSRRYSMLQSVRAFSLERLHESDESNIALESFAQYWANIAQYSDQERRSGHTKAVFPLFLAEHKNFEFAVAWAAQHDTVLAHKFVATLLQITVPLGFGAQGRHWIETILHPEEVATSVWHTKARYSAGSFFALSRDYQQCLHYAQATMRAAQALSDRLHIAAAFWLKALVHTVSGQTAVAITHVSKALELIHANEDVLWTINCLSLSARLHMMAGKYAQAHQLLNDAFAHVEQAKLAHSSMSCVLHFHRSFFHALHGDYGIAHQNAQSGLMIARHLNDLVKLLEATCKVAELEISQQHMDEGTRLINEIMTLNMKIQDMHSSCIADRLLGICAFTQGDLVRAHEMLCKARDKTMHVSGKPERESVLLWLIRCCLRSSALNEAQKYLIEMVDAEASICHFHLPSLIEEGAHYCLANNRFEDACQLYAQAGQLRQRFVLVRTPIEDALHRQVAAGLDSANGWDALATTTAFTLSDSDPLQFLRQCVAQAPSTSP
jgi:predicted ATPase/DNA-binding SARP family transcriptional activator